VRRPTRKKDPAPGRHRPRTAAGNEADMAPSLSLAFNPRLLGLTEFAGLVRRAVVT